MKLLLMDVIMVIFAISLICLNFFLLFIHVINTRFKLFKHESNVRLRFRRKSLFVLYRLRVKIKHNDVFIHTIPLACEYLSPKLLWQPNEKWKWSIEVINGDFRGEAGHQLAWPIERKQKGQQGLHDDGVHADVVVN